MSYQQKSREEKRAHLLKYSRSMQHMLDLDDEFPEVEMFGRQCISAEVGPGWRQLLRPVLAALRDNGCLVGQIKQKFGGLRVYWDFPPEIEDALAGWRALPDEQRGRYVDDLERGGKRFEYVTPLPFEEERERINAVIRPIIHAAEELAWRTCDNCGADLESPAEPSHRTQCDSCKKQR